MKVLSASLFLGALLSAASLEKEEDFKRTFSLIKASPGEARWDEIPWTTSLWEARKKAAALGKPLFIWAANGNPLGVT